MTRDNVIEALIMGDVVSGEDLAGKLGVSRMAVSKAVSSLREEGYRIESVPGVGYRLDREGLYNGVYLQALFGDRVKVFFVGDYEGSTNNEAKKIAGDLDEPFVVVARSQSGGRGRLGRSFSSPDGGLYFSLVLPERFLGRTDLITTSASLAAAEALEEETGLPVSIKWVNDLYINGRKAVGILTEGIVNLELGGIDKAVIGVGINLNTSEKDLAPSIKDIATTFRDEAGRVFDRAKVLVHVVNAIMDIQGKPFLDGYRRRCFVLGKDIHVLRSGTSVPAYAVTVDDDAHLVVRYGDGREEALSSAEVSLRLN